MKKTDKDNKRKGVNSATLRYNNLFKKDQPTIANYFFNLEKQII